MKGKWFKYYQIFSLQVKIYDHNFCSECDGHTYGNNCQEDCGICRNREECDIVTGVCSNGCDTGYRGDNCKESMYKLYLVTE